MTLCKPASLCVQAGEHVSDAAVEAAEAGYGTDVEPGRMRNALREALPHLVAERDARIKALEEALGKIRCWEVPGEPGSVDEDRLWGPAELGAYLGYSEATIRRKASDEPSTLPPRVQALPSLRWEPNTVRAWAASQSRVKPKRGRPRLIPA
jgi:predicted DNA-binding transcriptional regulator AlpA